MTEWRYNSTLS